MSSTCYRFQKGDVLYGRLRTYLSKVWLAEFDGLCSSEFIVLPESESILGSYLRFRLMAADFTAFAERQKQGDRPRADYERLAAFPLRLPDHPIQRRIATILDQADRLRRMRRYALELSDQFLPALFLRMFGDPRNGNLPFTQVELEPFLHDVASSHPEEYPNRTFRYIDISGVDGLTGHIADVKHLAGRDAPSRARQLVQADDILVSTVRPNLRATARVPARLHGAIASTGFCILRPRPEIQASYLEQVVRQSWFTEYLVARATGASYPAVSDETVKSVRIPFPPADTQRTFARMADACTVGRALLGEALRQAEHLFQSLLNRYFGDES